MSAPEKTSAEAAIPSQPRFWGSCASSCKESTATGRGANNANEIEPFQPSEARWDADVAGCCACFAASKTNFRAAPASAGAVPPSSLLENVQEVSYFPPPFANSG